MTTQLRRGAGQNGNSADSVRSSEPHSKSPYDVAIVGSGFGGLATALRLAEQGAKVVLCETLAYPGGCASTFSHRGYSFETGATLFSGLGPGQLFHRWNTAHDLGLDFQTLDPVVEMRTPGWRLAIPPRREALIERMTAEPGAPRQELQDFFAYQKKVADGLWALLDDPDLLPPFRLAALGRHVSRAASYLPLARFMGRPLSAVLRHFKLQDYQPLRIYLDALCQITVQCGLDEAEAPFALGTMDYYFRGTGHVRGGVGRLAWGMVEAIRRLGGEVSFLDRVKRISAQPDGGFSVETRRGELRARKVVANTLPQGLRRLVPELPSSLPWLDKLQTQVVSGWGACMLYRVISSAQDEAIPHHLELIHRPDAPFLEGNHIFCSTSEDGDGGTEPGQRTLTVSTHIDAGALAAMGKAEQAAKVEAVQNRMVETLEALAPESFKHPVFAITASPRTYARFTGRDLGWVGGVPRRHGLGNYRHLIPPAVIPGLHLVGDSVFPGQSTLATALGGYKLAERLAAG